MAKVVEAGPFDGSGDDIVDMGAADRLPEIKIRSGIAAKVVKVGPFGGSFGDMFDMGAADQLLEIKIRSGIAVDAIIITYLVNGRIETRRFGGEGGEESLQKKFRPGEFLIEISGSSSRHGFISSLNFRTNFDTNVPLVPEEDTPFSVSVVNSKIVGFFGRSADVLHAIGVNVVPT